MTATLSFDDDLDDDFTAIVIRKGSALRTNDEMLLCFIDDAIDFGFTLDDWSSKVYNSASMALAGDWLDDSDLSTDLDSLVSEAENYLSTTGMVVLWEDGYMIGTIGE